LQLEILALRHQLQVLERTCPRRVRFTRPDRLLWVWLSRVWQGWRSAVVIVTPETVLTCHLRRFRLFWTWKSRHRPGRPAVPPDVRALIRSMSAANPLWGAPRIHGDAERVIGSIRRECLDHVIVVDENGLRRVLTAYLAYYHDSRTHLALDKDSPHPRSVSSPAVGPIAAIPHVGGLHHRYDRRAA
jgi:hypothetical protein